MELRHIHPEFDNRVSSVLTQMKGLGFTYIEQISITRSPLNALTGRFDPIIVHRPRDLREAKITELRSELKGKFPQKDILIRLRPFRNHGGVFVLVFAKVIDLPG